MSGERIKKCFPLMCDARKRVLSREEVVLHHRYDNS